MQWTSVPRPPGGVPGCTLSGMAEITKLEIARNWLPRYTGMPIEDFGDYILLTNFRNYVEKFAERCGCDVVGEDRPMQAATNRDGLTIVNFGIGTASAATIMDLLVARKPKGVLFLGKCGGLKRSTEIGHFILPVAAIRGEGTSNEYFPPEVPALPSFKLHKFVSDKVLERDLDYRTGVVYTTNRRVWEHDDTFLARLKAMTVIAIDMETATIFTVGHYNEISRGALLLVSDVPLTPEGVKTEESDAEVTRDWVDAHLDIGMEAMTEIADQGEPIKHFRF
jgi:AMP nucleosidase